MESRFWHRRNVHPSVCPYPFKIFFFWKGMTSDTIFVLFVCLSVRFYMRMDRQTKSSVFVESCSSSPIFKILFLLERYDTRFLYLIHFVRLSVRTDRRMERQTKSARYKFRSNRPIFKILFFCLKGRLTPDTYI